MLTLYRRHKPTCPHFSEGRKFHHCKCAIWADGILGGREIRRSMRTRDWTKANREVQKWEAAERMSEQGAPVSLADAWESFLADLEARKLSYETIRKYKLLKSRITAFAVDKGLSLLADFDVDALGRFRSTWKDGPRTSAKTLERLRAFFRFAHDRSWVERNPATRLKLPKVSIRPTMPLTQPDMLKLLTACEACLAEAETRTAKMNALRLKSLVLLMRYSGMRISDAVTITTDRLDGNKLFLYTQKTGVPVYTVLPDSVLRALESTPSVTTKNFFGAASPSARAPPAYGRSVSRSCLLKPARQRAQATRFHIASATRLRWSCSWPACRSSASRFCSAIKACASPRSITTPGALAPGATRGRCYADLGGRSGAQSKDATGDREKSTGYKTGTDQLAADATR